jgi:membrane protein required for colicin V production
MLWIDNAIATLVAIYCVYGFVRGFQKEVYALMIWSVGLLIAWFFSKHFTVFLSKHMHASTSNLLLAFFGLILMSLTMGWVIRFLAVGLSNKAKLSVSARLGGLCVGFVQGLMVVLVFIVMAGLTSLPNDRWWAESRYIPPFQDAVLIAKKYFRSNMASSLHYPIHS